VGATPRNPARSSIREVLARDEQALQQFTETLGEAARQAGCKVGERSGTVFQVDKSRWDLDAFFYKRHKPDAIRQMIALFKNKDQSIFQDE
jgi:hypothetical protein